MHLFWIPHCSPPPPPLTLNRVRTSSLAYRVFFQKSGLSLWFPWTPLNWPVSLHSCPPTVYLPHNRRMLPNWKSDQGPSLLKTLQGLPNPLEIKFKCMIVSSEAKLALVISHLSNGIFYHFLSSLLTPAPLLTFSLVPASTHLNVQFSVLAIPLPSSLWALLPHFLLICWLRWCLFQEAFLDSPISSSFLIS